MDLPMPRLAFDQMPPALKVRVFDVDYIRFREPDGGLLYVTRYGWPLLEHLLPRVWFRQEAFATLGHKLPGGTGSVYYIRTESPMSRPVDLVVKFSRVAQEVPLMIESTFPGEVPTEAAENARFNSPFEEFCLLMDLRRGGMLARFLDPPDQMPDDRLALRRPILMRTKRPLAIYCPPNEYPLWRLGRSESRFIAHASLLDEYKRHDPQAAKVDLDIHRDYVTLFAFVQGVDAETVCRQGGMTDLELTMLTRRVTDELAVRGYRVLDNKPRHFILRPRRRDGRLLVRHGRLIYALVDFELLQRTETYLDRIQHGDPRLTTT
ncbi:MAG: hypothetical protein IT442_04620 [Phycisphaeraceae bacterium]|nr:hypothetical protein [Phycisphaeraceae bacterium]